MNRQDGPLLTGGTDDTTANTRPLLIRHSDGALVVTTSGSGGVSDVNLEEVGGVAITLGQKPMATSLPVVIASDQSAIPVTGSITASNPSVDATGGAVPSDATYIGINLGGNLSGAVAGHGTAAAALRVELPTDGTGVVGLAAGSQVIGHVITDTGSTTAATQATASALNATVIGAGSAGTANSGVVTVQGIASMTPVQVSQATASSLNAQVVGNIAHDGADSGNPIKVGNKAVAFGANPTAVASGDRTDAYANVAGVPFTLGGHPNVLTLRYNATAAETNTKLITVSGGTKIVMLACTIAVDKACTVNVAARVGFAATNTPTTTGVYLSHPGIAPGNGIREAGAVPGADGDDFILTSTVPTTGSVDVVMKYFTIAE